MLFRSASQTAHRIEELGLLMRRALTAFGGLSGETGGINTELLKRLSVVYHVIICLMYVANFAIGMSVTWDDMDDSIYTQMMKASHICWYAISLANSVIGFPVSFGKNGMRSYLHELTSAITDMEIQGISHPRHGDSRHQYRLQNH